MKTRIYQDGKSIRIRVASYATPQETYAAQELGSYLERMTSAAFDAAEADYDGPVIAIGKAAERYGVSFDGKDDDFLLRTAGENLCIAGGKRGVIYGVYEILERLGCRFFTATCEKVPFVDELVLEELDEAHSPDFIYREHNYYEPRVYTKFAVKSRLNGQQHPISEKYGGHIQYSWFVHSFENIVSPEEYGETHPEYFAMDKEGTRMLTPYKNQLCLSNPELVPIAVAAVRKNLTEHPEAEIVSISQNDWSLDCQCPECRRINEEEGASSGTLIRFVNAVAEELEPEFPRVTFDTLAYQYTRSAPKVRPRHNVCVRLCSIECCFAHAFEECSRERNMAFVKDIRDWHGTGAQLYIWDYTTCFNYYPTPHPNWRSLQPNMRLFRENGAKGVFEQACGALRGSTDLNELRAYLISKLLWDADTDVDRHMEEFTDYYYGEGGKYIRQYIRLLCDTARNEDDHVGFNDKPLHRFLDEAYLDQYDSLLSQAREAVKDDAIRLWRVEKARLSIRYVRLMRGFLLKQELPKEELNRFFADWESFGLTRMEEWCSPNTTRRALLRGKPVGAMLYSYWADEGPEEL